MRYLKYFVISAAMLVLASCNIDDLANPNGSSIEGFNQNASKSELQTLVTGMGNTLDIYNSWVMPVYRPPLPIYT